jgi:competence protein ComEC
MVNLKKNLNVKNKRLRRTIFILFVLPVFSINVWADVTSITLNDANSQLDESKLRVHFIDIGPGLAVLIQTPNNQKNIFIDGGKWGLNDMEQYVATFLTPGSTMDLTILTHGDYDHYEGMKRIFEKYQVSEFWYTGYKSDVLDGKVEWTEFLEDVENETDCEIRNPINQWKEVGDVITIDDRDTTSTQDDIKIILLNVDDQPPERDGIFGRSFEESERRNNASLVFKLIYEDISFLFTGDINGRDKESSDNNEIDSEELELWVRHTLNNQKFDLKSTVLQASHHGSNGASSLKFIEAVDPTYVVITAGHVYDHPKKKTLDRLELAGIDSSKILRTDDGDSTPENWAIKDPRGDDSYAFQVNGQEITDIFKIRME